MTTIPEPQTRRVDQLQPGDVIHLDRDVPEELAEVRAVEPITGTRTSLILLAGGKTITGGSLVVYELASAETAEQWRTQRELRRRRTAIHATLTRIADLLADAATPLPDWHEPIWITAALPDPAAVRTVAEKLGVETTLTSGGSRIHAYLGGYGDPYQVDFWAIADQGATDAG